MYSQRVTLTLDVPENNDCFSPKKDLKEVQELS